MSIAEQNKQGYVIEIGSLATKLDKLTDGRKRRGVRYKLGTLLILITLAKMAGEDSVRGIATWLRLRCGWLNQALQIPRKTAPHYTTISRVLSKAVDVEEFDQSIGEFCHDLETQKRLVWEQMKEGARQWAIICIDGKTLRGSIAIGNTSGVHLLAAWDPDGGFVMMQLAVDKKENEIVVAPRLLSMVNPAGRIVIGDAMHTQRNISIQIVTAGGHFIWFVKDNQPKLRQAIERLFTKPEMRPGHSAVPVDFQVVQSTSAQHGRIEKRTLTTSSMLNGYVDFPHCGQVFRLERNVQHLRKGVIFKESSEIAWGITDLYAFEATAEDLLYMTRHYWSIENSLHHRRDVSFKEDACRLRDPTAQHVMASLNNLALSLLLFRPREKTIPDERRYFAANPDQAIAKVTQSVRQLCV